MQNKVTEVSNIDQDQLNKAINCGIEYLYNHQLANGEFISYYSKDNTMQKNCIPNSTVFFTSVIASCLLPLKELPKVKYIHIATVNFLSYQMMTGGVWNYFTKWNPLFKNRPADLDSTVTACYLFKSLNIDLPPNSNLLLANRNSKGLFYTWFIVRPSISLIRYHWKVIFREFKYPFNSFLLWLNNKIIRNDINAISNANYLHYHGKEDNDTKSIIDFLLKISSEEKEIDCNKSYPSNPLFFYYFLSRIYNFSKRFELIRQTVINRIYQQFSNNGSIDNSSLHTALAISALTNFNYYDKKLDQSIQYLLEAQHCSGHWERNTFFYSDSSRNISWESEELTTAFCIEALNNYRTYQNKVD